MAVLGDVSQGTLTTSVVAIITSGGTEYHEVTFTNYSGSNRTVDLYINGSADVNRIGKAITLEANGGFMVVSIRLGNTDAIHAAASAATSVVWTDEETSL